MIDGLQILGGILALTAGPLIIASVITWALVGHRFQSDELEKGAIATAVATFLVVLVVGALAIGSVLA